MKFRDLIIKSFFYRFYRIFGIDRLFDYDLTKRLYQKLFISSFPSPQYYIELANQCNAECIFCTYPIIEDSGKALVGMNDDLFDKTIKIITEKKRSRISLTPTTGEVFMHKNWDIYIHKILELKFVDDVHFYSNAALLNKKNINRFFRLPNLNKMTISFSTGGIDSKTYNLLFGKDLFDRVQENINLFLLELKKKKYKIPVSIDIKLPAGSSSTEPMEVSLKNLKLRL